MESLSLNEFKNSNLLFDHYLNLLDNIFIEEISHMNVENNLDHSRGKYESNSFDDLDYATGSKCQRAASGR